MSLNKSKLNLILRKYFSTRNIVSIFLIALLVVPFILIFQFGINKKWYDGMSVAAILYLCFGVLLWIIDIAQFNTWTKLKKLFSIKKENNEKLTNFELTQMKLLKTDTNEQNENNKKEKNKNSIHFISFFQIIYGLILLCISLPFIF